MSDVPTLDKVGFTASRVSRDAFGVCSRAGKIVSGQEETHATGLDSWTWRTIKMQH